MVKHARKTMTAGIAILALAATPVVLAQGQGQGKGNGGGGKAGGASEQAGPPTSAGNGRSAKPDRGPSRGQADQGGKDRGAGRGGPPKRAARGDQGRGNAERGNAGQGGNDRTRGGNRGNNANINGRGANARGNSDRGRIDRRGAGGGRDRPGDGVDFALAALRDTFGPRPRLIDGCPPGLAKKRNGCLPPGQARQRYRSYDPGFFGLLGMDRGNYFYDDGYLLRYRGDGLAGYLPLLGGALGIGNIWPDYYEPRPVPRYYSDYYELGESRGYRYADNVIYRVDPETAAITSVAALLTGDDIEIGRPMPRGYDVYNVPYRYRDRYYDTPQARYRYADGYVYEIDPETALVAAAIDLAV